MILTATKSANGTIIGCIYQIYLLKLLKALKKRKKLLLINN
jgi:hypothetical protein